MIGVILAIIFVLATAACIAGAVIFNSRKHRNRKFFYNLRFGCVRLLCAVYDCAV